MIYNRFPTRVAMKIKSDYDHLFKHSIPGKAYEVIVVGHPDIQSTTKRWMMFHQVSQPYIPPIIPDAVVWVLNVNLTTGQVGISTLEDELSKQGIPLNLSRYAEIDEFEES
jgi:hypothetical protein